MKKFLVILATIPFAGSYAQNSIVRLTDAAHSRGYISWIPVTDAKAYKVVFFDKDNRNNVTLNLNTTSPYLKVDPLLFQIPNLSYQITAINARDVVIGTSDPLDNVVNPVVDEYELMCETDCNGKTYAYKYSGVRKKLYTGGYDNQGHPEYDLGNLRILPDLTYEFSDPELGIFTPYYQAIDQNNWNAISYLHPYKSIAPDPAHPEFNNWGYERIPLPANHPDVFLDANDAPVYSGMLVSKRLDQFGPFELTMTDENYTGADLCLAANVGMESFWVNFYNSHHDAVSIPSTPNAFTSTVVNHMSCVGAWEVPEGGEEGDDGEDVEEWFEEIYFDFAKDHEGLNGNGGGTITWPQVTAAFSDLADAKSPGGDHVTNVVFTNIHDERIVGGMTMGSDNKFVPDRNSATLTKGLYRATAITSKGKVAPYYMDIASDVPKPTFKDLTTLTVAPNPAENRIVNFSLAGTPGTVATYFVHDMNGTELETNQVTIGSDSKTTIKVDLRNVSTPMFHVMVSIMFTDGSVLQDIVEISNQ